MQTEDLLRMEGVVLQSLDFRINTPTAYTFLCLLKQHIGLPPRVAALAVYLLVSVHLPHIPCHSCPWLMAVSWLNLSRAHRPKKCSLSCSVESNEKLIMTSAAQELGLLDEELLVYPNALKAASAILVASACEGHHLHALTVSLQVSTVLCSYVVPRRYQRICIYLLPLP